MSAEIPFGWSVRSRRPIDDRFIVADLTARDALSTFRRHEGLEVYVEANDKTYKLIGGITNGDWKEVVKNVNILSSATPLATSEFPYWDTVDNTHKKSTIQNLPIAPSQLLQEGATTGQALVWDGAKYAPTTVSGGGGVPLTRTITINGNTQDLSADRTYNVGTVTSVSGNNGITGTVTSTGNLGLTGQALALHNLATNGLIARTGAGTVAGRTITGSTSISVSNGDGVSGNPTLSAIFGTTAGTVAQGNDSRINNGETAFGWGNHATVGYVKTASNLGAGQGVFASKVGDDLRFKSIVGGSNVTLSSDANTVTVSVPTIGESNTASNLGAGQGVFASKVGVDLRFKSLTGGANVTVTSDANTVSISSVNTTYTAGTGLTLIGTQFSNTDRGSTQNIFKNIAVSGQSTIVSNSNNDTLNFAAGTDISITTNTTTKTVTINSTAASSGEANTASNLGLGQGLFATKVGVDLRFKSLVGGSNVTLSSDANTVTVSVPTIGESNTASNLGAGQGVFASKLLSDLRFKSLVAGTNVTLSSDANTITINSSPSGEVNTASNLGAGEGVFASKVGVDLRFKSLVAGSNVTLSSDANTITVNATSAGEANTASNLGSSSVGRSVFAQKVGVDLQFRRIVGANGVSITEDADYIEISGGAFAQDGENLGAGQGVFASKVGGKLTFKSLVAGTNVTLSSDANTITINSSSGGSSKWTEVTNGIYRNGRVAINTTTVGTTYALDVNGVTYSDAGFRNSNPSGTTARTWKFGEADIGSVTPDRRLTVEVNGVLYWIPAEIALI